MLGVSRSDCKIWRAWAAYALLASVCVRKGAGGSLTNLSASVDCHNHVWNTLFYRIASASIAQAILESTMSAVSFVYTS